jgi:hypothetical protein
VRHLRVAILDFITHKTTDPWFESQVLLPNFASIMPQAVAAWAEELGCEVFYETFTGQEDLFRSFPGDIDVLFLSCFSRSSFLAYAVAHRFRQQGVITVLGGPHARSFAAHSRPYFDYVCQLTDKETVRSMLEGIQRQPRAVVLSAKAQPDHLPSVEQRARFIEHNVVKNRLRRFMRSVPMIGSVGCAYSCHFCIDSGIPYKTLPSQQLIEDLRFAERRFGPDTLVFWHDPNFGIRFKETMHLIEESGTSLMHGGESSLSLLGDENLAAMRKNRWVVQFPGIESWYGFNGKAASSESGLRKVEKVADHVNRIMAQIPYVQTNFVCGLDDDAGDEPFELTKRFVDLAPGAFPGYSVVTDFRNSPLSAQLAAEKRTLSVPYTFLDNTSALNVRLKNYGLSDFYDRLIDLQRYTWRARAMARRYRANAHRYSKVVNFARAITEGGWRTGVFEAARRRLDADPSFRQHYEGLQEEPPQHYFDEARRMLGTWWHWLPEELKTPHGFLESERAAAAESAPRASQPAKSGSL